MSNQIGPIAEALKQGAPPLTPAAATLTMNWTGIIDKGLSWSLMTLSIAFLLWQWRKAYKKDRGGG